MALNHQAAAEQLLDAVGGAQNIVSAAHCATRMRLVIADDSKVDKEKLEAVEGAKGNFQAAGQLQVIYGTGTVNKVYDAFVALPGVHATSKAEAAQTAQAKANPFQRAIKALGDVFVPIIPAIVASGLLMGLTEGINNAMGGALDTNSWYILIHTFSNASFVFLQILIAFSAARVFGGNEYLAAVIGMIMNHTGLINAWSIPGAVEKFGSSAFQIVGSDTAAQWLTQTTGTATSAAQATAGAIMAAGGVPQVELFGGFAVTLQGYQGHVIPVIIAVLLMCAIERWLHKHVPDMLDLFVTPLVTVLVTGTLTLTVIGPVFAVIENYVMYAFQFLLSIPFGLGGALVGAIYPATVVLGVHHMFNALEATLIANTGVDNFNPIISCANVAQGAACLAVFLKTRSLKKKELALPAGISGFLGITEPALYGVNLPALKPFIAAMIGSAIGGALVSILGVVSIAYGITGLFGFLITTSNTVTYAICIAVAAVAAFAITWSIYKDPDAAPTPEQNAQMVAKAQASANAATTVASTTENAAPVKVAAEDLLSPVSGQVVALKDVNDAIFASEAMGKGVAVVPTVGKIVAPADAVVTLVADTQHAIGLLTDSGAEVLIHAGIDTVELGGLPFNVKVSAGDHVKAGELLMEMSIEAIKEAEKDPTVMVIITNTDAYSDVSSQDGRLVSAGEKLISLS